MMQIMKKNDIHSASLRKQFYAFPRAEFFLQTGQFCALPRAEFCASLRSKLCASRGAEFCDSPRTELGKQFSYNCSNSSSWKLVLPYSALTGFYHEFKINNTIVCLLVNWINENVLSFIILFKYNLEFFSKINSVFLRETREVNKIKMNPRIL